MREVSLEMAKDEEFGRQAFSESWNSLSKSKETENSKNSGNSA